MTDNKDDSETSGGQHQGHEAHARATALFALEKDAKFGPSLNANNKEVLLSIAISLKRIADTLEDVQKVLVGRKP